jgi:DNA-binding Lrp family transcriptional regulator
MPGNNATRRKANAIRRILSRKAHTAEEKIRQLREAGVIERYGPNANINAILKAENEAGNRQVANYAIRKNNGSRHGSKHASKPANNHPKNAVPAAANKPVKRWVPVATRSRVGL